MIVGALGAALDEVPVRWRSAEAELERLALPDGAADGKATAVTEDGTVIGQVGTGGFEQTGYLWAPDGTGKAIPLPTVDGRKANLFWPESTAGGWILGRAIFDIETDEKDADGKNIVQRTSAAMKYRLSDGRFQKLPESVSGTYAVLAENGWVLDTTAAKIDGKPVIVSGDQTVKLPEYQKFRSYVTTSISADGRTAAGYTTDMGPEEVDNRPILWTCQ